MKIYHQIVDPLIRRMALVSLLFVSSVIQPAKATSVPTGAMTTARANHTVTVLPNGKLLVVGGSVTGASAEVYDPATGTWTATSPMVAPRSGAAALLPNGKVLVVGGSAAGAGAALYDPAAGTWASTSPMNYACGNSLTATLLPNEQVLVAGGSTITINSLSNPNTSTYYYCSSAELYDPVANTWVPTYYMWQIHNASSATLLLNGYVLIAGGAGAGLIAGGNGTVCEIYDPVSHVWNSTGSLNIGRNGSAATLLSNGKVLISGGLGPTSGYGLSSCEIYDPATGSWSQAAAMQNPRTGHTTTLLPNGQVLAMGGWSRSFNAPNVMCSIVEVYDPPSGTWAPDGPLTTVRSGHTSTLLPNGKVLVAGGGVISAFNTSYSPILSSAELYDAPGGTWTATGSMTTSRQLPTATLLTNGQVLAAGGLYVHNIGHWSLDDYPVSSTELYDPAAGAWTATNSMILARAFHTATLLPNGKVLVAGGQTEGIPWYVSSTEIYDPVAGTWATATSMNYPRGAHTTTLLPSGKLLVAGGVWDVDNPNLTCYTQSSAELYDPVAGTWTVTNSMTTERMMHTATLLPSGKVLVAGGQLFYNNGASAYDLSSAELYDPSSRTWTATASMSAARTSHTATLLPNGSVLVTGGIGTTNPITGGSQSITLSSAELYNPVAGRWTTTGSMSTTRSFHTATLLPSGKVLVAGGDTTGISAELFDPSTGSWALVTPLINSHIVPTATSHGPTATLLLSGEVLVTGDASANAELFDPPTGTPTGSLRVTLNPAGAATNGARWQVDGRVFQTNGAVVNNLSIGNHTVTFKSIPGWVAPTSQIVAVSANITNTFLGIYIANGSASPTISAQPQSQVANVASSVSFTVSATGVSLGYQWRMGGTNISGATGSSYTITNVQLISAGNYDVLVTNSWGAITSQVATLTVITPPSIAVQPKSQVAVVGWSVTFSVTAGGTSPHYQWQCNGHDISGATTSAYILNNVQPADAGNYTVGITNQAGSVNSALAVLVVIPPTVVVGWGANDHNQITIPVGLTNVVAVAAGGYHSLALKSDGTVVAWGKCMVPGGGDAGDATVPDGLVNVVAVAAGAYHSLALKADRTVVAWGYNGDGQTNVPSGLTNVVAIAAGYFHNLALKSDGTITAWGSFDPATSIPFGLTNVIGIAAGSLHSVALISDGTVVAWGYNYHNVTNVPSGLTNVIGIAAGSLHSVALKSDGTVVAWGYNGYNQTNIQSGLSNVVACAPGGVAFDSLALRSDGTLFAWGDNSCGQTNIPTDLTNVVAASAGCQHSLALVENRSGSPRLFNPRLDGKIFSAVLPSVYRKSYSLEYRGSLSTSSWTTLPTIPGNGAVLILADTNSTGSQRYYRVRKQ